jgi:single-strand DNA-binding protein|tara:strand:+ start:248 stop:739 length:492 start_codon:yes stop_codon:yes gene_type:complete
MSGINKVILVGRLGKKPEAREVNNKVLVTFSVATSDSWTDKNTGQKQEKTEWHNICIWGRQGEIAAQYLDKGSQVYLEGKIETRKYQDKTTGQDRYSTQIVLNGFDSTLQMLDSKASSDQRVPVPQAARSPQVDNSQLRDLGGDGQSIPPVALDDFEDKDIPF